MTQPVIGVTLDSEQPGGYSKLPWYALRQNYAEAVVRAGGLPVLLPHEPEQADAYLDRIDGLIITGGAFDVDPTIFGASTRHATVKTKDKRTAFELAITKGALERDKAVLGICGDRAWPDSATASMVTSRGSDWAVRLGETWGREAAR